MRFEKRKKLLLFVLPTAIAALLNLVPGCTDGQEKHQSKAVPDVIIRNSETMLTLDKSALEKSGIIAAPLKAVLHKEEFQAYGAVIQPDALIDIRNRYISAKASADKTDAALDASRKEYERLKKLNEDNRNISDKVLQAAGSESASKEADASASRERLQAVKQGAAAQWGKVVSGWIFNSSAEFTQLAELKIILIRITLPADKFIETAPMTISIRSQGLKPVSAWLVGRAPVADPRTQGMAFLYASPSYPSLLIPGMNVWAVMAFGGNIRGVVIPLSAVVWSQGKAWAYVQEDMDHFARREVQVSTTVQDGYFVREAFMPGEKVVIKGAQILLSRELLPSKPSGGGEEEEED